MKVIWWQGFGFFVPLSSFITCRVTVLFYITHSLGFQNGWKKGVSKQVSLNIYRRRHDHKTQAAPDGAEEICFYPPLERSRRQIGFSHSWWQTVPNWRPMERKTSLCPPLPSSLFQ